VVRGVFVGIATVDLVQRVERPPIRNEKLTALGQEVAAGGPAANAAVTFARLGGDATLVTALGGHPLARYVAEELASHGVRVLDAAPDFTMPPPVSGILITEATGDRQVVSVNTGEAWAAQPATPPAEWPEADVVLLDGHHPGLALGAAEAATAPVVLDGGSWKPVLPQLLPLVEYAVCSADFRHPAGTSLLDVGVPWVAVTHGPAPVQWWSRPRSSSPGAADRERDASGEIPVPSVAVRDTLGAGDAFHGAFAYALVSGLDFRAALAFGAAVASRRCATAGPRAWLADPSLDELARL
jgi:sugar/nucleoside kinase (ribokinase family)